MRVSDYNKATKAAEDDYLVIDGNTNGTRSLPAKLVVQRSIKVHTTFSASDWVGDEAPFSNTIAIPDFDDTCNAELVLPEDVTAEQVEAYQSAMILNGAQSGAQITVFAWGSKPTIDLPVLINIRLDGSPNHHTPLM